MTRVPRGAWAANNSWMSSRGAWPMVATPSVAFAMSRLQHHGILRAPLDADVFADRARGIALAASFLHKYRGTSGCVFSIDPATAEKVGRHDPTRQQARWWRRHHSA